MDIKGKYACKALRLKLLPKSHSEDTPQAVAELVQTIVLLDRKPDKSQQQVGDYWLEGIVHPAEESAFSFFR